MLIRRPGDAANYPVTLSVKGTYRLTGALSPSLASAISITASGVSLDLNGFTITPVVSPGTTHGIDASGQTDIKIGNGAIEFFSGDGIHAGDRARIDDVTARGNSGSGINVGALSQITRSTAIGNSGDGILGGDGTIVSGNTAASNQGDGIQVGNGSTVTRNAAGGNTAKGVFTGLASTVSENTVATNTGDGIAVGVASTVLHNTVFGNGGDGIEIDGSSAIIGNTMSSNTRCGLHVLATCPTCISGFVQNVLNSNNGAIANRQVNPTGSLLALEAYESGADIEASNLCSNGNCIGGTAANCP